MGILLSILLVFISILAFAIVTIAVKEILGDGISEKKRIEERKVEELRKIVGLLNEKKREREDKK